MCESGEPKIHREFDFGFRWQIHHYTDIDICRLLGENSLFDCTVAVCVLLPNTLFIADLLDYRFRIYTCFNASFVSLIYFDKIARHTHTERERERVNEWDL